MKRLVLVMSCLLTVAACGSTVRGAAHRTAGLTDEADVSGGMAASGGPGSGDAVLSAQAAGRSAAARRGTGASSASGGRAGVSAIAAGKAIQIGVLITDTDAYQQAAGVGKSYTAMRRDAVHAILNSINKAGGVAGRKLTAVDASMNFLAVDWSSEFEAACSTFTEDNHVGAVVYDGVVYSPTFNGCLAKAGVPVFYMGVTGSPVGDVTDLATNYPGLIAANSVSLDRRVQSILNKAIAAGFLHAGSTLGVVAEDCPFDARAYDRTVVPILTRHKINVVKQDVDCGQGSPSEGTGIAQVEAAVLRFKTAGVDSVMFHTLFENGVVYYFAQTAQQQHWAPQYLLFHPQAAGAKAAYAPEQLAGMRGFGGMPLFDVDQQPTTPPAQAEARRACLATVKSEGIAINDVIDEGVAYDACDATLLLIRALTVSGGEVGTAHLVPAVERVAAGFVSALSLDGATRFGPGRHDGMDLTAVSVYDGKCQCFHYITGPSPIQ